MEKKQKSTIIEYDKVFLILIWHDDDVEHLIFVRKYFFSTL